MLEVLKTMDHNPEDSLPILEKIRIRKGRLIEAGNKLKEHFVGLDDIIDQILKNIEVWYILPELISKPTIVNLWGMTGVGKTDLVRKLVKFLGMNDSFLEIQLTNGNSDFYDNSIEGKLTSSNIDSSKPGILLLDEVQRFRTIDDQSHEVEESTNFSDIWMLLSDGKFASITGKEDLLAILFGSFYHHVDEADDYDIEPKAKRPKKVKSRKNHYHQSYQTSKRLKKMLRISDSIEDIMRWTEEKKLEIVFSKLKDQAIYEGENYSKLLVFISGNLDEAFGVAKDVGNADTDADILYKYTKNINFITIKESLLKRFKPEQIARFGNVHVIYPSLSKDSYQEIVNRKIFAITQAVKDKHSINIAFTNNVNRFVYRNGVFPTQGVRPVMSTISSLVENSVPFFMLEAIKEGVTDIEIDYQDSGYVCKIGKNVLRLACEGPIDTIKKSCKEDSIVQTSIHEAGHVLLFIEQFEAVPLQAVSRATSRRVKGFVSLVQHEGSVSSYRKYMAVCMAGVAAEEVVFGKDHSTSGCATDIEDATATSVSMNKSWGMGQYSSKITDATSDDSFLTNNNNTVDLNEYVEKDIQQSREKAKSVIKQNIPMLIELSDILIDSGLISTEQMLGISRKYGFSPSIYEGATDAISHDYSGAWKKFKENDNG